MRNFLIMIAFALTFSASAMASTYRTVKIDNGSFGLLRALANKEVYSDFQRLMHSGNTVVGVTAKVNQSIRDASETIYSVKVQQCMLGAAGRMCLGGGEQTVTVMQFFLPGGNGGDSYTFDSDLKMFR